MNFEELISLFNRKRRIIREYKNIREKPETTIYELVVDEGHRAVVSIQGPAGTVYENMRILIQFDLWKGYPWQPPMITCLTPIVHPNIYQGSICLDLLQDRWTPALSINSISIIIHHLLVSPDVSNTDLILSMDHAKHKVIAMRHTRVWVGRKNFMLYLARIGMLNDYRHPQGSKAIMKAFSNRCYLQTILGYL